MASLFDWSSSAGSNTSVNGVSVAEGMNPGLVNNAIREVMALIRSSFASALQTFLAGTDPLPLANGGTAGTTAATARSGIGALADTYKGIPMVAKAAGFTLGLADEGVGYRYTGAAAAVTIDPVASTAYTVGAVFPIRNSASSSGALTLTRGAGVTLTIAGQTTSQNVSLAVGAMGSLIHEASNVWVYIGAGAS